MANTKISQLTANTNPNGSEELVYAYNNTNGKMSLNTMKTFAGTGKQDTLVSGTNIKTINNQSILGAGNIDIQGGGGGGGEGYDAIVDASGNGDYTTIGAAVDANKRKIYVMNGTYNETEGHFITMSAVDKLIIHGQSRTGVVVNVTLTSVATQWSESYDYPALLFLDASASDNTEIDIKSMTFNFSVNSSESSCNLLRIYNKTTGNSNVRVDDCIFNVSNDGSNRMLFTIIGKKNRAQGTYDVTSCSLFLTSNTANMYLEASDSPTSVDDCNYKNCYFLAKANSNLNGYLHVNNAFDCVIKYDKTNMGDIEFKGENLDSCDISLGTNINSSVPLKAALTRINNCNFEGRHTGSFSPIKVGVSSEVANWASSTSYAVGAQVVYSNTFYQCTEAHTSSTDFDTDKWTTIATIFINDATLSTIRTGETVEFSGVIKSNNINMSYDNGDLLLPNHCIFEGNFMEDDSESHNMYVNEHSIVNGNVFGGYDYANPVKIRYSSTKPNVIVNNIVYLTTDIAKIGTGSAGIVDNNTSWS